MPTLTQNLQIDFVDPHPSIAPTHAQFAFLCDPTENGDIRVATIYANYGDGYAVRWNPPEDGFNPDCPFSEPKRFPTLPMAQQWIRTAVPNLVKNYPEVLS